MNTRPHPLFVAAAVPGLLPRRRQPLLGDRRPVARRSVAVDRDRMGAIGHAAIWDPLFIVWGALLLAALARTRPARHPVGATRS